MLMKDVRLDMEDASHVTTLALDWKGIAVLAERIGDLTVDDDLVLSNNKLESLPE